MRWSRDTTSRGVCDRQRLAPRSARATGSPTIARRWPAGFADRAATSPQSRHEKSKRAATRESATCRSRTRRRNSSTSGASLPIGGKLRSSHHHRSRPTEKFPARRCCARKIEALRVQNSDDMDGPGTASAMGALSQLVGVASADAGDRLHEPASDRADARRSRVLLRSRCTTRASFAWRHSPAGGCRVRRFVGASIARWEGDTLVVETRNFKPDQNRSGDFLISTETVIVERFARVSHDELSYRFTITDPDALHPAHGPARRSTGAATSAIFEDACHEGNYSLKHILEGGRVRDGRCARRASSRRPARPCDDPSRRDKRRCRASP